MRPARLLLAALLVAAPLAPLALSASEPPMKCCPLHEAGGACCPDSSCSLRRCAPSAPAAVTALPPAVVPDRFGVVEPALTGRVAAGACSSLRDFASGFPDPPPRA